MRHVVLWVATATVAFLLGAMLFRNSADTDSRHPSDVQSTDFQNIQLQNTQLQTQLADCHTEIDDLKKQLEAAVAAVEATGAGNDVAANTTEVSDPPTDTDAPPDRTSADVVRRALETVLQAYPGEKLSFLDLSNRASQSDDDSVKALGFQYGLLVSSTPDGHVGTTLRALSQINATTPFAAQALATPEMSSVTDEQLLKLFGEQAFPRNWGAAIALSFRGNNSCFNSWAKQAKGVVEQRGAAGVIHQILKACNLYPVEIVEGIAISAARHEDFPIVKRAAVALYRVGTHAATLELQALETHESEEIRTAALMAKSGIPF